MNPSAEPMLKTIGLSKSFGRNNTAVDELSISVYPGEIATLLGPNGAGKSTSMKMISGFLLPDQGQIFIGPYDLLENPESAQALLGYLPEGAPGYAEMEVEAFLSFCGQMRGFSGQALKLRLSELCETLSLEAVWYQPLLTLSKGYGRRVCLAQALIHRPSLLVLDEPTDGLDPNQKRQVQKILQDAKKDGAAVLISTHLLDEVDTLADRILMLHQGRLLADETPSAFKRRTEAKYTTEVFFSHGAPEEVELRRLLPSAEFEFSSDPRHMTALSWGEDLEGKILSLALEHQWDIRAIHSKKEHLEEIFSQMTQGSVQ